MTFTLDRRGHLVKISVTSLSGYNMQRKLAIHRIDGNKLAHHGELLMF